MTELALEFFIAIFGSSVLTVLITGYFSKKKNNADAAAVLVESNLRWTDKLVLRIDELEKTLEQRNQEIISMKMEIVGLRQTIEELKESLQLKSCGS